MLYHALPSAAVPLQRRAQDTTVKLKTELCLARVRSCAVISGWKIENEIRNRRPSFKLCRNLARHCRAKTQLGSVNIPLLVLGLGSREGFQSLTDKIINTVVRRTPLLHGSRLNWPPVLLHSQFVRTVSASVFSIPRLNESHTKLGYAYCS